MHRPPTSTVKLLFGLSWPQADTASPSACRPQSLSTFEATDVIDLMFLIPNGTSVPA